MLLILDASAILSGIPLQGDMVTSPLIEKEFTPGGASWRTFQYLKKAGLKILLPSDGSLTKIRDISKKTGDLDRLSPADREILALAYDLRNEGMLLSDDYSIQNIAQLLHITYSPLSQKGITEIRHWIYRCMGCNRLSTKGGICPVCGSPLKMVGKR
mgnify:CR=1 FL=1